jgi:enoyl-CoA hydratase/carnithine racemase
MIRIEDIVEKQMDARIALETMTSFTQDRHEAVQAFQEKRKPKFTKG